MKVAYNWLQEYIKTSLNPEDLAEKFRLTSSEVDSLTNWQQKLDFFVVGKVIKVEPHPEASKLQIATVSLGNKTRTIVCGAPNLVEGLTVVVALPGARVVSHKGESLIIQETILRGVKSEGMLCGASEIPLPYPDNGSIMELSSSLVAGTPLAQALHLDDTVLDLEVTPNRPDLLSYRGLAREIATFEKKRLPELAIYTFDEKDTRHAAPITITIEDSKLCSRYSGICLEVTQIGPSPDWLQARLILSGIRPINSIVDVTNYVMLELGQPLHAFDLDALLTESSNLRIRAARSEEKISLLGEVDKTLQAGDIVMVNQQGHPLNLAGIMGNEKTGISNATQRVFLESAVFLGSQIRRTSRNLAIRTEASTRFEKGLDPEQTVPALKRAIYLLQEISQVKVISPLVDIYPRSRIERPRIHLSFARIQQILGVHISANEAKIILQHLGFQIPSLTKSSFEVIPPTWRKDVSLPEDVMEELIRIWGYDRLPSTIPTGPIKPPQTNHFFKDKNTIRHGLAALGMHECLHLSFTAAANLRKIDFDPSQSLKLPLALSSEIEYLIPNHLVNLLENVSSQNQRYTSLALFEIGHVFLPPDQEKELLSLLWRGNGSVEELYRLAKSHLDRLKTILILDDKQPTTRPTSAASASYYQEGTVLDIQVENKVVGKLGYLKPSIIQKYKIRSAPHFLFATFDLDLLLNLPKLHLSFKPASIYPQSERDITMIIDSKLPSQEILDILEKSSNTQILQSVEIKSIYRGKPLSEEQKSVTLHCVYNSPVRTLEDGEINEDQKKLITLFRTELSAQITE